MPSMPGACLSALLFFPIYHGAALIHSPLGARGTEAAPRMHNSIWRQEKVTPAAQATETAHTYVMSHFVMPRHALPAPSGCAKPETKPVPMMPFLIICAPTTTSRWCGERIPHRNANDQLGWFRAISQWRVGDLNLERIVRWEILPSNQKRGSWS